MAATFRFNEAPAADARSAEQIEHRSSGEPARACVRGAQSCRLALSAAGLVALAWRRAAPRERRRRAAARRRPPRSRLPRRARRSWTRCDVAAERLAALRKKALKDEDFVENDDVEPRSVSLVPAAVRRQGDHQDSEDPRGLREGGPGRARADRDRHRRLGAARDVPRSDRAGRDSEEGRLHLEVGRARDPHPVGPCGGRTDGDQRYRRTASRREGDSRRSRRRRDEEARLKRQARPFVHGACALTLLLAAPPLFGMQAGRQRSAARARAVGPADRGCCAGTAGGPRDAVGGHGPDGPPPPSPVGGGSVVGGGLVLPPRSSLPKKRYIGRRIDLDFKGADIHNILRLLSDVGQVNIVTSDDVKGEVTIKMRNVPWDQALDVILRAKLLGQVREGNLIRVAPLAVLEKELEQEIARQEQLGRRGADGDAHHRRSATPRPRPCATASHDLLSPRGRVSVDERTNQLIVSDVAAQPATGRGPGPQPRLADVAGGDRGAHRRGDLELRAPDRRPVGRLGVRATRHHGNPTGLVLPVQRRASPAAPPTATAPHGRPAGQRRRQPELRRQPAGRGRHRQRRRAGPDAGLGGRRLQPEPAPVGAGDHRPGPHPVVAAHLDAGQHRGVDRAGRVDPDLDRQRRRHPDGLRRRQART